MTENLGWILLAFVLYLILMIIIGAIYAKKNTSSADFFLGGRQLGGFVAALSAQASDMSGWLLMGLPGSVYALGTGQVWIAVGLFIGTVCNWLFISKRLRRYTIRANNSVTIPAFFRNRFRDEKRILLGVSSITIVIFFLVYTASALAAGGKLFNSVFGLEYKTALGIGAVVILVYTYLGGFWAVCTTDFIQGMLMLIGILAIPIAAVGIMGAENVAANIEATGVDVASYLDMMSNGDGSFSAVEIISQLAWGLGYFGMPHILIRFMAIRDEKELAKSKVTAIIWVALSLAFACVIGVVGRAYLYPEVLSGGAEEKVFIEMIIKIFTMDMKLPVVGGLFLCGIMAAIMSTADSQLLVSASSMAEDIYCGVLGKKNEDKKVLRVSRITVLVIAVLAFLIALDPNSSIMGLVSNAWAGLGAAFGPIVIFSLFWKRTNLQGAIAGVASGALAVIVWDYLPLINGRTLGSETGLYSLVVGFALSMVMIIVVSLLTPPPSAEMLKEFEDVRTGNVAG